MALLPTDLFQLPSKKAHATKDRLEVHRLLRLAGLQEVEPGTILTTASCRVEFAASQGDRMPSHRPQFLQMFFSNASYSSIF
jgi:hypothetical protein